MEVTVHETDEWLMYSVRAESGSPMFGFDQRKRTGVFLVVLPNEIGLDFVMQFFPTLRVGSIDPTTGEPTVILSDADLIFLKMAATEDR